MLHYELTKKQFNTLEGLAFWVADQAYTQERYPDDQEELRKCKDTITKSIFPELDNLKVPFWVQNAVVFFGSDWKQYRQVYLESYLKSRNVTVLK